MKQRLQRPQLEQLYKQLMRERTRPALAPDDRVWLMQDGQRVVHVVMALHGDDGTAVEMVCGMFGEQATPHTRRAKHPFVTKTTAPVTCLFCLPEEPQ